MPALLRYLFSIALLFQTVSGVSEAQSRVRVAVLPVHVNSATDANYLRQGVADMLAARLGQHHGVAVIRVDDTAYATNDREQARQTARSLGAQFVLFGSFTRFGEGASLDLQCAGVTASEDTDPRSIFVQSGRIGELIPQLDAVVTRVAHYVNAGPKASEELLQDEAAQGRSLRDALAQIDRLSERVQVLESGDVGEAPADPLGGSPSADFDRAFEALTADEGEG